MKKINQLRWLFLFSFAKVSCGIHFKWNSEEIKLKQDSGISDRAKYMMASFQVLASLLAKAPFLMNKTLLSRFLPMNAHFLIGAGVLLVMGILYLSLFRKVENSPVTHMYNAATVFSLVPAFIYAAIRCDMLPIRIAEFGFFVFSGAHMLFFAKNRSNAYVLLPAGIAVYSKYILPINGLYIAYAFIFLIMFVISMMIDKFDDEV